MASMWGLQLRRNIASVIVGGQYSAEHRPRLVSLLCTGDLVYAGEQFIIVIALIELKNAHFQHSGD